MRNTNFMKIVFTVIFTMFGLLGCEKQKSHNADHEYIENIQNWDAKRIERLKSKTGWLNLAGLLELKDGVNTFGSDLSNDIIFPKNKSDKKMGEIVLNVDEINITAYKGVAIFHNDEQITNKRMFTDADSTTTILNHKNLSWFIIKRGEKYFVRLRDYESDLLTSFHGIERYPIDTNWVISAKYILFDSPKTFIIPDVLGNKEENLAEGYINFSKDGKDYSLIPVDAGKRFFIIFADLTSGKGTYGAGRFLYSNKPDSNGNLVLDFNKAYNPPCAFTKFATCPMPPEENYLKLELTAGEKSDH